MSYKISVIVPVYNAENDLKRAIESIINQTIGFKNIELILVDDASIDDSKNIIKSFHDKYENIKLIELSQNSGFPGKPRSLGVEYASADYIIFLDSDDTYCKDAFEILYGTIQKEDLDFVIASHYLNLDGNMVETNLIPTNEKIITLNPLVNQQTFDKLSLNHFVAPWGKIFKKKLIIDNNMTLSNILWVKIYLNKLILV